MSLSAPTLAGLRLSLAGLRAEHGVWALCFMGLAALSTCSPSQTGLDQVRAQGVLKVATINSPTTYYVGPEGPTGFEYDLAEGFSRELGVKLEVVLAGSREEALAMVQNGQARLVAAGLAVSRQEHTVRYTQPLLSVVPELVYSPGRPRPRDISDLQGVLRVPAGSSYVRLLQKLKRTRYPGLEWQETTADTEELLYQVANSASLYTIANSDLLAIHQRYYPQLRVAFALSDSQDLAWAFAHAGDSSLFDAASDYLARIGGQELKRLRDRYFGQVDAGDYVGAMTLAGHTESRLPPLRAAFDKAAERQGFDWRLLAAIGYQESHWNPRAVSPTGVRGIMMLTLATADYLGVRNREDPAQSIEGGARYFRQILDKLPASIPEPDRSWMALAAYNQGYGHLLDARVVAQKRGGDPNRWLDVRQAYPLLTKPQWYNQLKYGYARGYEAVTYVGNVRQYYDMLVWITNGAPATAKPVPEPPLEIPDELPGEKDLLKDISSPVL